MAETLLYGFKESPTNGSRLSVSVPLEAWEQTLATKQGAKIISVMSAKKRRSIALEPDDSSMVVLLNDKRIGQDPDKRELLKGVVWLLGILNSKAQDDPKLSVHMGVNSINNTGRYAMDACVRWPEVADSVAGELASKHMQEMAVKLKYSTPRIVADMVYAQVSRLHGVTLETNPLGSCSLDTDGSYYNPEDPVFELDQHNIYIHEQQVICLAGAVAIAHADELVNL